MIEKLAMFKLIFVGVIIEALPFILLGSLISSLINEFVSEEKIQKLLPKNPFIGIIMASFIGLIFPVCECAIVPIVRRLMKKGVPVYMTIPLMVSVPIVNPVVLFSTYIAFESMPEMVVMRGVMGLMVAWLLGVILYFSGKKNEDVLLKEPKEVSHACCDTDGIVFLEVKKKKRKLPIKSILHHTTAEFYDIGKLLLIGAAISALFKIFVPQEMIVMLSQNNGISVILMMLFAFIISLCSEVDAFIARTYIDVLPNNAILAFLVLGPMIDIKNFLMLRGTFKKRFVITITLLIFILVFLISQIVNVL